MAQSEMGGTFCQFRVGRSGTSGAHLRYISRESAVRDREKGVLLYGMSDELTRELNAGCYDALRLSLIAHAWAREAAEPNTESGRRGHRTHYRATFGFEWDVGTDSAKGLVEAWLKECFPRGRALAFVHRDTAHLHVHVWLDARGQDGKKLNLSARAYRELDEKWNRHYAPFMGRDVDEHLRKKREGKAKRGRGDGVEREGRPSWRELDLKSAGRDELTKVRAGRDEPEAPTRSTRSDGGERASSRGEPELTRNARSRKLRDSERERAVSETSRLREALVRLGERERELEKTEERER